MPVEQLNDREIRGLMQHAQTYTHTLAQTAIRKDNDYLGDSRVNMWAAQTHKSTAHHFQFTSGANCPPSLSPFPSHFLTPPRLVLCLFIFPISSPKFHGLRNQTQLHWLTEARWHNIPSKVTLPFCASISHFPPLHVSRSVFIRLSSFCHSLPIPWPWSVFLMGKKKRQRKEERGWRKKAVWDE